MSLLFTPDVLFVHVPKAGGSSVTFFLFDVLPRPIWYVREVAYDRPDHGRLVHLEGKPHATLDEADVILRAHDLDLHRLRLILAVVRNPYEVAVSEYAYVRRPDVRPRVQGRIHGLAADLTFPEYVSRVIDTPGHVMARLHRCYSIGGQSPANLRVIRCEELADGVRAALGEIGIESDASFPWLNASPHDDYLSFYDSAAEEAIYQRCRWVFEQGYYERLHLTTTGFNATSR